MANKLRQGQSFNWLWIIIPVLTIIFGLGIFSVFYFVNKTRDDIRIERNRYENAVRIQSDVDRIKSEYSRANEWRNEIVNKYEHEIAEYEDSDSDDAFGVSIEISKLRERIHSANRLCVYMEGYITEADKALTAEDFDSVKKQVINFDDAMEKLHEQYLECI